MSLIASKDLIQLHQLMLLANRQSKGYEVWADTIHMAVYRSPVDDHITEWTKGEIGQDGKLVFRLLNEKLPC